MKRKLSVLAAIILTAGLITFTGCSKSKIDDLPLSKKNVQLVPESEAISIAQHFKPFVFYDESNSSNRSAIKSTLTGNNNIKAKYLFNDSYGNPALYIFNFEDEAGYLVVSADYQLQPVLAFVERGEFKKDIVPAGLINWFNRTMENIEAVRKGLYDNSKTAAVAWRNYYKQNGDYKTTSKIAPPISTGCTEDTWTSYTIGPLLPVTWGQGCTYNDLCPNISCNIGCGNGNAWTGCVATATSQIIRYWHPSNSYNYNYTSMPATSGNGEVQRMMRDVGSKVGMSYGCSGSSTSAANPSGALKSYFGFSSANYVGYDYQRVSNNIGWHWPVLLNGCNTSNGHWFIINWYTSYSECHEWVCDGTNSVNVTFCENGQQTGGAGYLYFHMNWGWHEIYSSNDYNGWFAFNNWNIPGLNWNFQYANGLTSDIHT